MHNTIINTNSNSPNYNRARIFQQQSSSSSSINEYKTKLFDEIAILMRAFGDVSDVNLQIKESIILVEKILIHQLKSILELVLEISSNRGCSIPQQIDFEYMMHRNKPKLIRFRKYMRNIRRVQYKNEQKQQHGANFDANFLSRTSEENDDSDADEQEVYDAEKIRRIYRADRISQILSPQKYEEFQKARSYTSNLRNKMNFINKLVEILQLPKEIQEDSTCLEIVLFLAQETVATLVDFSILTRLNSENRVSEPVIVNSNLSNDEILNFCPEVTQGRGKEGIMPIRVQEIQEAIRRVFQMNQRKLGATKNIFLAL